MSTLSNKTALILGASSEGGVGWATAERFAAEGARVIVAARRIEPLQKLAAKIGAEAVVADIGREESVLALADAIRARHGHVDLIVNAAGHPVTGVIPSLDTAGVRETTEVEFFGTWFLLKHLAPVVADGGAIVSISSLSATMVVPGFVAYASAKAAANTMLRYAAVELAPRRIRVNAILPGIIDTPMNDSFRHNAAIMQVMTKEVPFGRMAAASEIAAAALWLCQDECFSTGTQMVVDGGNHLRRAPFPEELPTVTFAEVS